jgi:hypothetical protein
MVDIKLGDNTWQAKVTATLATISVKTPLRVRIALMGYVIVVIFILGYMIAVNGWLGVPRTPQSLAAIFALLISAPLVLPFIWDRLTTVKAFSFEFDLASAKVHFNNLLPNELHALPLLPFGDGPPEMTGSAAQTIAQNIQMVIGTGVSQAIKQIQPTELIPVDIGAGDSWWSTRLYLLAALAKDYTGVRRIVFVETLGDRDNCFIGMAMPAAVCRALARQTLQLEVAYRTARSKIPVNPSGEPADEVELLIQTFLGELNSAGGEFLVKNEVTKPFLKQWLCQDLSVPAVEWDGSPPDRPLLWYKIMGAESPFVALVSSQQLKLVVNRDAEALKIANTAIRQQLEQ